MRISATGAEGGFTLVELLVVVAIIGLAGAAVVLAMPDPRGDLRQGAERFAARVSAARDRAVIEARDRVVWVSPSGYRFEREEPWPEGSHATATARVRFDTVGQTEPVDITLIRDDERVTISIDADSIHVE